MKSIWHKITEIAKVAEFSSQLRVICYHRPVNGSYDLVSCIRTYEKYITDIDIKELFELLAEDTNIIHFIYPITK